MRRDVSSFLSNILDIETIATLLDVPEHRIYGAYERKMVQYVQYKFDILRFDKQVSNIESGTSIFLKPFNIIRGFPKISRAMMLYPSILKHFSSCKTICVEEKMNGYNTRVTLIGNEIVALTRGGFICPYTTEKANLLIKKEFFDEYPNLVLCGEMVGPDNPYVPMSIYDVDSLEFFVFDIREKVTGIPLPIMERRKLLLKYGIKSVKLFGEYDIDNAHIEVKKIIKEIGKSVHEGVIIKDPDMRLAPIKYTTSETNCADLSAAFEFYYDYGKDFMFSRICREAFQSVEWDEDEESLRKRCLMLGESILFPMVSTIRKKKDGEKLIESAQIRVKSLDTAKEFETHLKFLGVDAIFGEPIQVGDEYIVKIDKINHSTSDKTDSILNGNLWS